MLDRLLTDLQGLSDLSVHVILRGNLISEYEEKFPEFNFISYRANTAFLSEQLDKVQLFWPIAPESQQVLENLTKLAESKKIILLNSTADAVAIASSKKQTCELLNRSEIASAETVSVSNLGNMSAYSFPWVLKPEYGVDCEDTYKIENLHQLNQYMQDNEHNWVVQPYIPGESISLSGIFDGLGNVVPLCVNKLGVSIDSLGTFIFSSMIVNAVKLTPKYIDLLDKIAKNFPGLKGFVGIDAIDSGESITVLEVNPRLTTAYVGIGQALGINVTKIIISLLVDNEADLNIHPSINRSVKVKVRL